MGRSLFGAAFGKGQGEAHLLLSSLRWEYTQGFPFCGPVFVPGNRFHLYGPASSCEGGPALERVFRDYLTHEPYFPVRLDQMAARFSFAVLEDGARFQAGPFSVLALALDRPWRAFAFRVEAEGAGVAYIPDTEAWMRLPGRERLTEGARVAIFEHHGAQRDLPAVMQCGAERALLSLFPAERDDEALDQDAASLASIPEHPRAIPLGLAREGESLRV